MLGICGTGMSALAGLLQSQGAVVSGSDTQFYPPIGPMLGKMGVRVLQGYDSERINTEIELFIVGNVVGRGNAEVERLLETGFAYESMAEALYRFVMAERSPVVVAGTHGKTTTTAFLAYLFSFCGQNPGYFIAGNPVNLDSHYHLGSGEQFFVEGDEYETAFFDRSSKFLHYRPRDLILTALEHDHVDFFPEAAAYQKSFANLINTVPGNGVIIYNQDYPMAREVIKGSFSRTVSYGFSNDKSNEVMIGVESTDGEGISFSIPWGGVKHQFRTPLLGQYNLLNLCAGILYGFLRGLDVNRIREAVSMFQGVARRMTRLGQRGNTLYYEDFAHHPTAISAAIQAVRDAFPHKELLTVLEPRSWSLRRNRFADSLYESLKHGDETWICEIYQKEKLAEAERLDVNDLAEKLKHNGQKACVVANPEQIWQDLLALDIESKRVILLLSNGAFGGLPGKVRSLCESVDPI